MLAKVFWNSSQFPPEADSFRAFIYGPLGGTITCCYIWKDFSTSQGLNKKLL